MPDNPQCVERLKRRYLMLYPALQPLTQPEVLACVILMRQCRRYGQSFEKALRDLYIPTSHEV